MVAQATISPSLLGVGVDEIDGQNCSIALKPKQVQKSNHGREKGSESNEDTENKSLIDTLCGSTMSSSPPVRIGGAPTSAMVRSRFLHRLGFSPPNECNFASKTRTIPPPRLSSEDSFEIPLLDHNDDMEPLPASDTSSLPPSSPMPFIENVKSQKGITSVRFDPVVIMHPIPSHSAYSSRFRDTIWISGDEMEKSIRRNRIEFAAENWDWHEVVEENDMFCKNGELVHPVHSFIKSS